LTERKLEIGPPSSGITPDGEPDWHTVDAVAHYGPTYVARWGHEPLPIASNAYDRVHASHVLEHVPWWLTQDALREVYRILKPGGWFTIWVPDALKLIQEFLNDPDGYARRESDWPCAGLNPAQDPWVYLNARVFWGARPGELGQEQHFHRALFGCDVLTRLLMNAGFTDVKKLERAEQDAGHGWMEIGLGARKPQTSEQPETARPNGRAPGRHAAGSGSAPGRMAWGERLGCAIDRILETVPPDASFLLADDGQWGVYEAFRGRRPIPFTEQNGEYAGPPADENQAIAELQRHSARGVDYLVLGWPAFWWLDYYAALTLHLRRNCRCLRDDDHVIVFALHGAAESGEKGSAGQIIRAAP